MTSRELTCAEVDSVSGGTDTKPNNSPAEKAAAERLASQNGGKYECTEYTREQIGEMTGVTPASSDTYMVCVRTGD